jgi:glycosyltransferase involved in cell wall biosynthesis
MNDHVANPKTVLFSGHDLKFIRGFVAHCQSDPRYRVLIDQHPGHQILDTDRCLELLPSADVIFCEWCLGNAKWYSQRKRPEQRLLVRLHHQEMELPFRHELEWDNVDAIIFTNVPHYRRFCREQAPQSGKAVVICCDVDCDLLDNGKLPGAEFNLGLVGINPMRKRPDLAFAILQKLRQTDSRYTLFFKTRMPWEYKWLWDRPPERDYFNDFFAGVDSSAARNSIVFDAHGDDMPLWYSKVGFILSASDHEGSHQAVAEGMAAGCIPIVRNWDGATPLYPPRFVFSSVDEAVELIREYRAPRCYAATAAQAQAYAREHFDRRRIYSKIEALFNGDLGRCSSFPALNIESAPPAASVPPVMILGYLPPGFRGGYRIRIEQEIKELTRLGCQVHLACLHPGEAEAVSLAAHRTELEQLGCAVSLVPTRGFFDVNLQETALGDTVGALQRIVAAGNFRLLHAEALYCARIGLLLKPHCPGLRLVFDCHGASPEEELMGGAHPSRVSAMRDWERRALAEADLNVFVSEAMNAFYVDQYGLNGVAHAVVPCCVADDRFPPEKSSSLPADLPAKGPIVAYLGTMAVWQCGEELIRLFAQVHRADPLVFFLLLIPQTDHARTRSLMRKHHLPASRVLLTELPHDRVAATMRHAHAGVLLRRGHAVNRVASPTKFGEYLAAGVPVIMTEGIGDFSRLARRKRVGLVLEPGLLDREEVPPEEISRIIGFLRESSEQHQQMSTRCRRTAREHLHWNTASTTLLNAYRGIWARAGADVWRRRTA